MNVPLLATAPPQILFATSTNTTHTPITDAQGSTMALLDAAGVKTTGYNYEPFGKTTQTGADGGSNKFTGREDDGTGLYFYRARYYSPDLQRFISEDPIGFAGGDTNLYAYVGNAPTNSNDPSGLSANERYYKNLGDGWTAGVDRWGGGAEFEIHVFDKGGNEVGIVSGQNGWINKHKKPGAVPPGIPDNALNRVNGINVDELRRGGGTIPAEGATNSKASVKNGRYLLPGR